MTLETSHFSLMVFLDCKTGPQPLSQQTQSWNVRLVSSLVALAQAIWSFESKS